MACAKGFTHNSNSLFIFDLYIRNHCHIGYLRIWLKQMFQLRWWNLHCTNLVRETNLNSEYMILKICSEQNIYDKLEKHELRITCAPDMLYILWVPFAGRQCIEDHQSQNNKDRQSSASPPDPRFQLLLVHPQHNLQITQWFSILHTKITAEWKS